MPDPSNYDNEGDFVSACIKQRQDEHPEEDNDQSVAICYSIWSEKAMTRYKAPGEFGDSSDIEPPDDDQSYQDFMDDCMQGNDYHACDQAWHNKMAAKEASVVRKTSVLKMAGYDEHGMEFILSDATPDRYEDVIDPDGWSLDNFKRNPIALFNHDSHFPIGKWEKLGVKDGSLRGHLKMAPEGTSPRIDEIRRLIEAGILRATSVGFIPREYEEIPKSNGYRYTKSELVETSLVSVPANPNALAVAEKLGISAVVRKMVFTKHSEKPIMPVKKEVVLERSYTWGGEQVVEKYYKVY